MTPPPSRPICPARPGGLLFDPDRPYQLSTRLVATPLAEGGLGTQHASLKSRCTLTPDDWALLDRFRAPCVPRALLGASARPDELLRALAAFVDNAVLVPAGEDDWLFSVGGRLEGGLRPANPGFLASSPFAVGQADFCVLGIPLDRSAPVRGAAGAPAAIRWYASTYMDLDPRTGRMRGLRDEADGTLLLEGARLVDHGDVVLHEEESLADCYRRVRDVVRGLLATPHGLPVFLGGDHSVTTPILDALLTEPTFLVHFDAHTDLGQAWERFPHHHGSFMDRTRRNPHVAGVLQVGMRAFQPPWAVVPDGVTQVGARRARGMSAEDLLALIPTDRPCYLTIDIDVVDPADAPGTGTPVPCGLPAWKLEELVEAIARERDLCGFDLVEVAPVLDRAEITSMTSLRLLLRVMDAAYRRRQAAT